jgi:hypothetical protein
MERQSPHESAGGRGEFAGRNTSERRVSIDNSTSEYTDSTGAISGASLFDEGEACHWSRNSKVKRDWPERCKGRRHAKKGH